MGALGGLSVTDTAEIVVLHRDLAEILVIDESDEVVFKFSYGRRIERPCDIVFWGKFACEPQSISYS